jgi:predicted kinase
MAMRSLADMPAWQALDPTGQAIVATSVALHDVGKPSTTRFEDDCKITSRGHSSRGDHIVRAALWKLDVPFALRESICALVRNHQVPFFGITKPDAERLAIRLSLVTRNDHLTLVAEADGRGRRCLDPVDQTRIIDHCALWQEHCRELGVLDRPRAFASPHTRRVWFESDTGTRHPDVLAHDDTTCEVILMSGLPASGKDHWLRTNRPGLPVVSLDDIREDLDVDPAEAQAHVIAEARERARNYLRTGVSFAWNATNLSASLRSQLLGFVRGYRARTHVVYVETSASEQRSRNAARSTPVPAKVIDRMIQRWSVPDPTEAHEVTYLISGAVLPNATDLQVNFPPQPVGTTSEVT